MTRDSKIFWTTMAIGAALWIWAGHNIHDNIANRNERQAVQQREIEELKEQNEALKLKLEEVDGALSGTQESVQAAHERLERLQEEVSRGAARSMNVTVTAYDLSPQSCGKAPGSAGYGITATGISLAGHSLESARAIAVDPSVIPLGSKVRIKFRDEDMKQYNGIYTAVDTGGAINGNHIDLFAGEGSYDLCMAIGRREARITVL